jgi:NADPH:quinone reductase
MKAVCVTPERELEVRDAPAPGAPPEGHVLINMEACAINHGDHTFLKMRSLMNMPATLHDIWGASGAGRVVAAGPGVPQNYMGKKVAIYRSISMIHSRQTVGLWSEQAQVHYLSCLILPDHVDCRDYSGSLVNIITAYAFLRQIVDEGHRGIIATAGNSATGRMLVELARREGIPALAIVRSPAAQEELGRLGVSHVLVASDPAFETQFAALAEKLKATAIFEGVGGALVTRLLPLLPMNSTLYSYGFMAGPEPVSFPTVLLVTKNIVMKGFSNFASATVQNPERLSSALTVLSGMVDHPAFRTRIGGIFPLDQIGAAMKAETEAKSILVP